LDVGGTHLELQGAPIRVDKRVALAPFHLLACVVAARAASLGGLGALAIEHAGGRAGGPTHPFAVADDQV
jgi:hypothetical protein